MFNFYVVSVDPPHVIFLLVLDLLVASRPLLYGGSELGDGAESAEP